MRLASRCPAYRCLFVFVACIQYCIDAANMVQIPCSWIELLNLLNHRVRKRVVLTGRLEGTHPTKKLIDGSSSCHAHRRCATSRC